MTDTVYFGGDSNQNGRFDAGESQASDGGVQLGLRDLCSLENREPSIAGDGSARLPIVIRSGAGFRLNPGIKTKLTTLVGSMRAEKYQKILEDSLVPTAATQANNRLHLLCTLQAELSDEEFAPLWTSLIGSEGRIGLIDAWSCSNQLLTALIGTDNANAIVKVRPATAPIGPGWFLRALRFDQTRNYGALFTVGSYQFCADVLAIRNDGAGWTRLEVMIDCSSGTAVVTSVRNAENLGWPLPWCTPEQLRRRDAQTNPVTLLTTDTK
jgi:hypothetical protein